MGEEETRWVCISELSLHINCDILEWGELGLWPARLYLVCVGRVGQGRRLLQRCNA